MSGDRGGGRLRTIRFRIYSTERAQANAPSAQWTFSPVMPPLLRDYLLIAHSARARSSRETGICWSHGTSRSPNSAAIAIIEVSSSSEIGGFCLSHALSNTGIANCPAYISIHIGRLGKIVSIFGQSMKPSPIGAKKRRMPFSWKRTTASSTKTSTTWRATRSAAATGSSRRQSVGFHAELSRLWSEPLGLDHGTLKN